MQRSDHHDTQQEQGKILKTGTTTVGLTADEGVILATDMRASVGGGRFVSSKNLQKVIQVHPTAAVTFAGAVSGAQAFINSLQAEANLYETRRSDQMSLTALSTVAANSLRGQEFMCQPIMGGVDEDGPRIYDFDVAGGIMEDEYTALGSGMQLAYGILEQEYATDLSLDTAADIAVRAVKSAIERDTASGNGIYLAEITSDGVDIEGHSLEEFTHSAS